MKVFKYGRKSPWLPSLTELCPKIQEDAGSWFGTKHALYYYAQSANSFSWVLFVSWYTTAHYCLDHGLSGSCTTEMHAVRKLSVWNKIPIWFQNTVYPKTKDAFPKMQAWAYNRYSRFHLSRLCVNIREFLKDTTTTDIHEIVAWKREFYRDNSNSLTLSNASELFWSWISINHIQVHEENEFCHSLFTSFTKRDWLGIFTGSRAVDGKEMCKKSAMHVQSLFFVFSSYCLFDFLITTAS